MKECVEVELHAEEAAGVRSAGPSLGSDLAAGGPISSQSNNPLCSDPTSSLYTTTNTSAV